MRYRMLSATGDYTFGQGSANFWINSPNGVAQSIVTRLLLWQGEWFLDNTAGTPIAQDVLGYGTQPLYDMAIKNVILATPGVTSLNSYESSFDPYTRELTIMASVNTQFSSTPVTVPPVVL